MRPGGAADTGSAGTAVAAAARCAGRYHAPPAACRTLVLGIGCPRRPARSGYRDVHHVRCPGRELFRCSFPSPFSPGHLLSARGKLRCPRVNARAQWSHFAAGAEEAREVGGMRETLVLNASFEPLSTVSLRRAVVLVMQDKAVVEQAHPGLRIRAADVDVPVPQVIRLCRYVRVPFRQRAPWSRRGVLVRDRHRCAYCGRRATTVDHLVPRSHGGGRTPG